MARRDQFPEPEDNGQSFADMNVDGMPWYLEKLHRDEGPAGPAYQMNKQEGRAYMWGALAAALLVVAIFTLVFAAVILLMLWFIKNK